MLIQVAVAIGLGVAGATEKAAQLFLEVREAKAGQLSRIERREVSSSWQVEGQRGGTVGAAIVGQAGHGRGRDAL